MAARCFFRHWFVVLSLLAGACGPPQHRPDCFKSTGPERTEERLMPPYRVLEVHDNINVVLTTAGRPYQVAITAGRNLLPQINSEVDPSGKLILQNENQCNWVRSQKMPITAVINVPDATQPFTVYHLGESTVRTAWPGMRLDTLFLHQTGTGDSELDLTTHYLWMGCYEYGDVILRGRANELHARVAGIGYLKAAGLDCMDTYVEGIRDGDAYVRASRILAITLHGRGNAYYSGEPIITELHSFGPGGIYKVD